MTSCIVTAKTEELSAGEAHSMMESLTQDRLGLSRLEFLRRLDAGAFDGDDSETVVRLKVLAPFAR